MHGTPGSNWNIGLVPRAATEQQELTTRRLPQHGGDEKAERQELLWTH
jgi:hypothetical protein